MTNHHLLHNSSSRIGAHCWGTTPESVAAVPAMAQVGCRWLRATRQTQMDTVCVGPGVYDWAKGGEHSIDLALQNGMSIMAILDGRWGNETGHNDLAWCSPIWEHLDHWCDFVRAAVRHYRGRIQCWEVLNEPPFFWWHPPATVDGYAGDAPPMQRAPIARYAELLKVTASTIREEDPDALIICGSGFPDGSFLQRLYACGARDDFDIVSVHYLSARHPEDWRRGMTRLRAVMAAAGDGDKPLWDTENGPHGAVIGNAVSTPLDYEALYQVYRHCCAHETDLARYFWFNPFWGEVKTSVPALEVTPPYRAMRVLYEQLGEGGLVAHYHPNKEVHAYVFAGRCGLVTVLWSTAPATVTVPAPLTIVDHLGASFSISGTLTLNGRPLYVPGDVMANGLIVNSVGTRETVVACWTDKLPTNATPTVASTRLTSAPGWDTIPLTIAGSTMHMTPPTGGVCAVATPLSANLQLAHDAEYLYLRACIATTDDEALVQFALNDRDPLTAEWPYFVNGSCLFNLRIHNQQVIASRFECLRQDQLPTGEVSGISSTIERQGGHLILISRLPWSALGHLRPGVHQPFFSQFTVSRHDAILRLRPGDLPEEWSHNLVDTFIVRQPSYACWLRCD